MTSNVVTLKEGTPTVSVIIPIHNAQDFLDACLQSVQCQETSLEGQDEVSILIEVSMYDDCSTDKSPAIIHKWTEIFANTPSFSVTSTSPHGCARGVGFAKNRAVEQSSGEYLCFCDADDLMQRNRIIEQYHQSSIIGSQFTRLPADSTKIFTHWANCLTQDQLYTQIYQAFGPSLVMPTWFCHRRIFDRIPGGFNEEGKGIPEDLIFYYEHINRGGSLYRVDQNLMTYRYHPNATTFSVPEEKIWTIRLTQFENHVLSNWEHFTIWGAGRLGRRFFRSLVAANKLKLQQFCDIDAKKIKQGVYVPCPNPQKLLIPIVHFTESLPPYVVCIKAEYTWDLNGIFRSYALKKELKEGKDYFYFN